MATKIRLKKSGATGNTPSSGDLELGELALNYADGILYYKDDANTIQQISGAVANTFETINANGTLIIADAGNDILTLNPGTAINIAGDGLNDAITIGVETNDTITSVLTTAVATANAVNTAANIATLAYALANSGANTVAISQNSGSTLSAKQLNFVNTANVTITVTDSGDGNANVEIFSAAGGGAGIADFPVSANTGSTVTANALNFNNTSSVIVNVESGIDGNANISFTSVGAAANLQILDEGSSITAAVTSIDFVGSGVSATANGSNVTVSISGGGGGSNTIIGSDLFTSVNADANLTYTLSEAVPGTNYVFVVKNGISLTPGVDYVIEPDYQTLKVIESGAANDSIEVRYFTPLSAVLVPNTTIVIDSNTVTSQTNTFFLTSNVTDITLLTVTKNGLFLTPNSHFTLSNNNIVTLTTVAEVDDELVFRYFRDQGIDEVSNNSVSSVFTANGVSNTYFMNSFALDANNVLVTIDGVVLTPGVDYSVNGPVLTINYIPAANSVIESRTITGGGDGSPATLGFYRNSFVGDGNTVNFTLGQTPYDEDNCLVFVDSVLQGNADYNVSATTLSFTIAPDANTTVDVFVTNYLATNKALIKTGDTMTGNLNVAATLITQNVEPAANITYDLGTSTKRFKDLWLSNSTIYLGEATISANGGNIVVPSIQTSSGINVESVLADAYNQANNAFSAANNRVLKAGDTMTGELNVANNLVVTGNVGIGTTSLAAQISLGSSIIDNKFYVYDAANDKYGFGIRPSSFLIYSGRNGDANGGILFGNSNGTTFIETVRFTNSGRVGIGTSNPVQKLEIDGGSGSTYLKVVGQNRGAFIGQDSLGMAIYQQNNALMYFATNDTERMRLTAGGSLLLGTTSDNHGQKLAVANTIFLPHATNSDIGGLVKGYFDPSSNAYAGGLTFQTFDYNGSAYVMRDVLDINGRGMVRTTLQPFFYAEVVANGSAAGVVVVRYTNIIQSRGTIGYNTSNGRFTAPVAGVYHFDWVYLYQNASNGMNIDDGFNLNGTFKYCANRFRYENKTFGDGYVSVGGSATVYLNASDYFEVMTANSNDADVGFYSAGNWGYLQGCLLG